MASMQAMPPPKGAPAPGAEPPGASALEKILPVLSIFTMAMTVPQVWTVWTSDSVKGVSLLSWGAYLLSACLWFFYGLQKRDKTIYVACIGWVILNGAVVAGVLAKS